LPRHFLLHHTRRSKKPDAGFTERHQQRRVIGFGYHARAYALLTAPLLE
jgi:hypothetical protein